MDALSAELKFEEAARCRDQIVELRQIQQRQHVEGESGDLDVAACATREGVACVQVFVFRQGRLLGNRAYFPALPEREETNVILSAFLAQYYLDKVIPAEVLLSHEPAGAALLTQALQEQVGYRVGEWPKPHPRGERARAGRRWPSATPGRRWSAHCASRAGMRRRLEALREAFGFEIDLARLECFDISHTHGEATVAACVVFDAEGARKSDYRRYNIEGIAPGDDYAAMHQALDPTLCPVARGAGTVAGYSVRRWRQGTIDASP